ncbi:MAG: hypothetical protein CSA96_05690 [Bacteroidetes bacterium]|nr:MAG: hypothetical protein CSA96_05690 [Bacteroidota bacterium]
MNAGSPGYQGWKHGLLLFLLSSLFAGCSYRFYEAPGSYPLPGSLKKQLVLSDSIMETSGLLVQDGLIWSFNDSGGEPVLYACEMNNGQLHQRLLLQKAQNHDWESIAANECYVFVADVGNNYQRRDTLDIYMFPRSALAREGGDGAISMLAPEGVIRLHYDEPRRQNASGLSSHDCEALLACGDSLYLFSKDWVKQGSSVYSLPIKPGLYHLKRRTRYEVDFLVTGADINREKQEVVLLGYKHYMPVVAVYRYGAHPYQIEAGGRARVYPLKLGRQVEGIAYDAEGRCYVSAERAFHKQQLFRLMLRSAGRH